MSEARETVNSLYGYPVEDTEARQKATENAEAIERLSEEIANVSISNHPTVELSPPPVGTVFDAFQPVGDNMTSGWVAVGDTSTIIADTEDYLVGVQSIRFTGTIQRYNANIDRTGKRFRVRYKVNAIDAGATLTLYLSIDNEFSKFVAFTLFETALAEENKSVKLGEWTELDLPWSACSNLSALADITTINVIRLRFLNGSGDANIQTISLVDESTPKGIVSFTFDDGSETCFTKAAKILGARDIPATAYIIPEHVGSSTYMTEEQITTLKTVYGWDIEGHSSPNLTTLTEAELKSEFASVKSWIQEHGFGLANHYAYPQGAHNALVEKTARKYFASARTIDSSLFCPESTPDFIVNPYRIKARSGAGSSADSVTKIKALIDRAAQYGGWVVLVFHHIGDNGTTMYCSEDSLAEIADYAVSSGAEIKTVADALRYSII